MGVAAVIGPQSAQNSLHVQSICDAKEMPHIETRWDPITKMPTLNIYPDPPTLAKVFVDIVKAFEWKSFTILYENGKIKFFELYIYIFKQKGFIFIIIRAYNSYMYVHEGFLDI